MRDEHELFETYRGNRYFSALDGLRAISVLAVVWHHTGAASYRGVVGRGYLGVDQFFAISGFLITTLLLREHELNGTISLRKFYARRTLRIFPLYYLVLLAYIVFSLTARRGTAATHAFIDHLPAFFTYTSNWFVGLSAGASVTFYFAWSLATEEQFYLLWPPVLSRLLRWTSGRLFPAGVFLLALCTVNQFALRSRHSGLEWQILRSIATPILLGAMAALVLHSRKSFALVAPILAARLAPVAVLAALLLLIWQGADELAIQVSMVVMVAALCIREPTYLHRILAGRPLRYIGRISYGIYLMHLLAANLVRPVVGRQYGVSVYLATVFVVIIAASISYRYFERPILELKSRYRSVPLDVQDSHRACTTDTL